MDAARLLALPHGGWVPRGRWAEDGPVPPWYQLVETPSPQPRQRTRWNVRDSDATLIVSHGPLRGGSALTRRFARELGKPCLVLNLDRLSPVAARRRLLAFLSRHQPATLNVAGPRASHDPRIYAAVLDLLLRVLG